MDDLFDFAKAALDRMKRSMKEALKTKEVRQRSEYTKDQISQFENETTSQSRNSGKKQRKSIRNMMKE